MLKAYEQAVLRDCLLCDRLLYQSQGFGVAIQHKTETSVMQK